MFIHLSPLEFVQLPISITRDVVVLLLTAQFPICLPVSSEIAGNLLCWNPCAACLDVLTVAGSCPALIDRVHHHTRRRPCTWVLRPKNRTRQAARGGPPTSNFFQTVTKKIRIHVSKGVRHFDPCCPLYYVWLRLLYIWHKTVLARASLRK